MGSDFYILDDNGLPLRCTDITKWAKFYDGHKNRRVAEHITHGIRVSTVFLGIDHSYGTGPEAGPPVLWETMTFGTGGIGWPENNMRRYTSAEDAMKGHLYIMDEIIQLAETTPVRVNISLTDNEVREAVTDWLRNRGKIATTDTLDPGEFVDLNGIEVIPAPDAP